jgi:hypothetical protein
MVSSAKDVGAKGGFPSLALSLRFWNSFYDMLVIAKEVESYE